MKKTNTENQEKNSDENNFPKRQLLHYFMTVFWLVIIIICYFISSLESKYIAFSIGSFLTWFFLALFKEYKYQKKIQKYKQEHIVKIDIRKDFDFTKYKQN